MTLNFDQLITDNFSKVAEVQLIYHNKTKLADRPHVKGSNDAYNLLIQTWDKDKIELQEQFRVLLLDQKNSCLGISTLATGGINYCPVDLKLVFALALKARATGLILAHNHPSGNTIPSDADCEIAERFEQAAEILDLRILDHLIITKESFTSMYEKRIHNQLSSQMY